VPSFTKLYDTLLFEYGTTWGSESEEPIDRGPDTLALEGPLFDDYFESLHFNFGLTEEGKPHENQWESES
jgi:hypothetical protein